MNPAPMPSTDSIQTRSQYWLAAKFRLTPYVFGCLFVLITLVEVVLFWAKEKMSLSLPAAIRGIMLLYLAKSAGIVIGLRIVLRSRKRDGTDTGRRRKDQDNELETIKFKFWVAVAAILCGASSIPLSLHHVDGTLLMVRQISSIILSDLTIS